MSENTTASTELTSQYAAQVTSDLERNLKEQERISGEIAALQEQLTTLQHDHTVLMNMQQALGITLRPEKPATAPEHAAVPAPRKKAARSSGTGRATKSSAAPSRARTRKSSGKAPVAATTTQPSLVELIRQHLTEQSEPRSTAEVAAALAQAHPERGIKNTVVRTTIENLVARGQAQRTKQGNSVYYIAPDTHRPAPSSPTESQQQGEAQSDEAQ